MVSLRERRCEREGYLTSRSHATQAEEGKRVGDQGERDLAMEGDSGKVESVIPDEVMEIVVVGKECWGRCREVNKT